MPSLLEVDSIYNNYMDVITKKPQQLTASWAQKVIDNFHIKTSNKAFVDKVNINAVNIGTTTRIRLVVDHNLTDFPKHWFVKLPSLSWRAKAITALPRLLPTEVRFYNELASRIPLRLPKVIAAQSRVGIGSTLVMSDVSESGAVPGKAGDALSAEQARAVVQQLARLHMKMADKAQNDDSLHWLAGPVRKLEDLLGTALAVPLMKRGLRLAGDKVDQSLNAGALMYAKKRKQVMRFLSTDKPTLVHHDCHPGNLFWHDGQPGFLDWQMVRIGEGISDISYFLATALEPELRRQIEIDLLKSYCAILSEEQQTEWDFNYLLTRYRAQLAYPFEAMVVTLAVGGLMQLDANLEMIRRSSLAIADHDTFRLLPLSV